MTSTRSLFPYSGRRHADPAPGAAALEVRLSDLRYAGAPAAVLRDLHLRLPAGERVALIGANGAGKSTLLKAIAGLLPTPPGAIRIYGLPIGACHHRVAYLAQRGDIDWRFPISVRELVLTGRYVHLGWLAQPRAVDHERVEAVLARLQLTDLADRQIGQLSGGQQQRALLARALAQEADLLLLDEPLTAVDADTRQLIGAVLKELRWAGKTVLAATHELDRLDADYDSALYLERGRLVAAPAGAFVGRAPQWQPVAT